MRTFSPKAGDIQHQWHVIDASDVVLGRLASHAATLLRGKHKPIFAPHVDTGDFVIVVNAEKVALSGGKLEQKRAYRHSGYPGGLRSIAYGELLEQAPGAGRREGRQGHAAEELAGPQHARASSRSTPGLTTRTRRSSRSPFEITQVAQYDPGRDVTRARRAHRPEPIEEVRGRNRVRAHWHADA